MEQKELFNKTISDALNNYPFSDEETVMKHIMERANSMSNSERKGQTNFREIPVEYVKPQKEHKVFSVFAGIVGTAAVLTGAVFGLNWLNEHGGLHEGGIETDTSAGAGYHNSTVSEYSAYTMIPTILPEETVFQFNGLTVKPIDYVYDGLTWQISYEMTYTDGIPDNFENDVKVSVFDGNSIHSGEKLSVITTQGNTATLIWSQTGTEVMQSREARFMVTREELFPTDTDSLEALGDCSITVDIPDDSHVYTLEPNYLTYIFDETGIQQIKKANICKYTLEIVANSPEQLPDDFITDIKIVMKDGTELHPTNTKEILNTFSMDDKMEHYFVYSLPGIDTSDIDRVYINDMLIDDAGFSSIQENLAELYKSNNDVVGWIRIGSTDDPVIDYPVVQADDNDYYLTHNVFKDEVERGAIFADFRNNFDKGLLSGNTVLYGHNMWYGDTMFANLSKYYDGGKSDDDLSFYKEHPTVTFNTLYENAEWKVFACVLFNTQEEKGEVYPYDQKIDFADADEFNSFIIDIMDRSVLWTDVDLTYGDSILTLSTPYYPLGSDTDTRVAVFARKVRPGESSEVDVSRASRNPDPLKFEFQYQIEGGSWSSSFADSSQDFYSQDNSKPNNAASDEVVDFLANIEQLVNSSEQIEELKQLLLKIEGVADVQVYNSDDDSQNTESQITEGKVEKGMVVKVFYDNGESWVQYTKQ